MRQCGDCNLCCKLLPVVPLGKRGGERCKHQRHTGCAVYHKPGMPPECAIWNCRWLVNDDTANLSRPDRSHYVIDIMPDFVTAIDNETGRRLDVEVIQIWVDPKHRDAHKDPALRAYIERRAEEGKMALIRYSETEAFNLLAPAICGDGQWHEIAGESTHHTHTAREIREALR